MNSAATNLFHFEFDDNNNNAGPENGDDYITYSYSPFAVFSDNHRSGIGGTTVTSDATNGAGAFHNDGAFSVYEISHPLNSGEVGDFARSPGDVLRFLMGLQIDGTNTNWPGSFPSLTYQSYTICCTIP